MNTSKFLALMALAGAAALAGCTVSLPSAPAPTGPSELGLSLALAADRDVMSLSRSGANGASTATISVSARDQNGQPAKGVRLRIDVVSGMNSDTIVTNSGTLSLDTITTDNSGQTSVVFTAPVDMVPGVDQRTSAV